MYEYIQNRFNILRSAFQRLHGEMFEENAVSIMKVVWNMSHQAREPFWQSRCQVGLTRYLQMFWEITVH